MGCTISVKCGGTTEVVPYSSSGHLASRMRQDSSRGEQTNVVVKERNAPDNMATGTKSTRPDEIKNKTTMLTGVGSSSRMDICRPVQGPSNIVPHDTRRHGPTPRLTTGMDIQKSSVAPNYHSVRSTTTTTPNLSITTPSGVALIERPIRPIQEEDGEFVKTRLETCWQFTMPSSIHKRNITASIELENGDIILCDQRNKQVLLLCSSMTHKSTFICSSNPHNITNIGRDKIAVTLPEENFIMVLEIDHDTLVESDKIQTHIGCRGIEHIDDKTFYIWKNSICFKDGGIIYEMELAFKEPVSLTSERNKHVLHVCCRGEVVTFNTTIPEIKTMSKEKVSTLSHEHLKEPVSCTVDQYGDMYICDVQSHSCIHVARHGEYSHVVLGSVNEIYQHIRYMRQTDCFMITEKDCNVISFYRLTKIC